MHRASRKGHAPAAGIRRETDEEERKDSLLGVANVRSIGMPMPGRLGLYDDYAKRALAVAQDEAWRVFHHDSIGAEHLMLGVLRCGAGDREGWIVPSLKSLGLDVTSARTALEKLRPKGDPNQQLEEIPFTPEGNRVIDQASTEAKELGVERVTPKHILLATLREPGTAAMLQSLGLSSEVVRQKIIDIPR